MTRGIDTKDWSGHAHIMDPRVYFDRGVLWLIE